MKNHHLPREDIRTIRSTIIILKNRTTSNEFRILSLFLVVAFAAANTLPMCTAFLVGQTSTLLSPAIQSKIIQESDSVHGKMRLAKEFITTENCSNDGGDNEEVSVSQASHRRFVSGKRYNMMHDVEEAIVQHDPDVIMKANEMIARLEHLYQQEGLDEFKPDVNAYNLLLNAHAKSNAKDTPQKAEQVLNDMISSETIQPNAVSYTEVIDAYARSKKSTAPKEAERILFQLMDASANEVALHLPQKKLAPTSVTCNAVIRRVDALLERSLKMYKSFPNNIKELKPTVVLFNAAIHTHSTRNAGAVGGTNAERLLRRMRAEFHLEPDTITYNSVMNAFSNSGHINAAKSCERLLNEMVENSNKAVSPNTVSYNSVLKALSKSRQQDAAGRAEELLEQMLQLPDAFPDAISFTSILTCWAKSSAPDKAIRARNLLRKMEELEHKKLQPNIFHYNALLNACAFTISDDDLHTKNALQVAVSSFTQMRRSISPDAVTYGNLLKCIRNLVPILEVRQRMTLQIFKECCKEGCVDETLVWIELQRSIPPQRIREELFSSKNDRHKTTIQWKDLPKDWTRQIVKKRATKKRKKMAPTKKESPATPSRRMVEHSYDSAHDI